MLFIAIAVSPLPIWLSGLYFVVYFSPSAAFGVGSKSSGTNSVFPSALQRFNPCVCTVGNNPNPVPPVGRSDGTSRNNKRLDGISFTLKTLADSVEGEPLLLSVYVILLENIVCASQHNLLAGLYHR